MSDVTGMRRLARLFPGFVMLTILSGFLFILAYALYYQSQHLESTAMYKYYILSVVGMVTCWFVLGLKYEHKVSVTMTIVSVVLALYAGELFLYFSDPLLTVRNTFEGRSLAVQQIENFDKTPKSEFIMTLRRQGEDVYPGTYPAILAAGDDLWKKHDSQMVPLGGVSNKTTVYGLNEGYGYLIFKSDKRGFNNPPGMWSNSPVDLLLLGDSYTIGESVQSEQTIAAHLRRYGNKVMNLAMGMNGPLLELAALREYGPALQPKQVLWVYFEGNDLMDLSDELITKQLPQYLEEGYSQNLMDRQDEIDQKLTEYLEESLKARLVTDLWAETQGGLIWKIQRTMVGRILFLRHWTSKVSALRPSLQGDQKVEIGDFITVLRQARDLTDSWGGELWFVYLPDRMRFSDDRPKSNFYRDEVLLSVSQLGIDAIDIAGVFEDQADPLALYMLRDLAFSHFTAEGYQLAAETIRDKLQNENSDNAFN